MHVEWLLELILEVLGLLLLLEELLLKQVNLAFQIWDALGLFLSINELSLAVLDPVLQVPDVLHLLLVVDLTLLQS